MARMTPEEVADKQANRLKSSVEEMRRGMEKITVAPTQQAAAAQEKMKSRLVQRIDDGTWAKNTRSVTLADWQDKAINVGIPRVAAGIDAARGKQVQFYQRLLPAVDAAKNTIANMPSTTLEDNINRMTKYVREMSKFRK